MTVEMTKSILSRAEMSVPDGISEVRLSSPSAHGASASCTLSLPEGEMVWQAKADGSWSFDWPESARFADEMTGFSLTCEQMEFLSKLTRMGSKTALLVNNGL